MHPSLLEILVEPRTHAPLTLEVTERNGEQVIEGRLTSSVTENSYPIVRGIPRFVDGKNYTHSFGFQWNRFSDTQIDSRTGHSHSRQRFDAETGLGERDLGGRLLLDVGCGAGRFAEVAAARGPRMVALDFSSAVDSAARTLARFPNVDVVQASLFEPPFAPGTFDIVYCIGVVQHTPDPPAAVESVVRLAKPDGRFALSIYARRPWTKLNGKYLLRPITRRLPPRTLLKAIERVMPIAFPVADRLFRIPVLGRGARFALPVATYVDRDEFTREQRYREAVLDTFDMLSPKYDSPMTWREVDKVLKTSGAQKWTFRTRVPINVVGVK